MADLLGPDTCCQEVRHVHERGSAVTFVRSTILAKSVDDPLSVIIFSLMR